MRKKFNDLIHKKDGLTNNERRNLLKLPHQTTDWDKEGNPICDKDCPRCVAKYTILAERVFDAGSIDIPGANLVLEIFNALRDEHNRGYQEGYRDAKKAYKGLTVEDKDKLLKWWHGWCKKQKLADD
jgi:hypothetical protein